MLSALWHPSSSPTSVLRALGGAAEAAPIKTPLYDFHLAHSGSMVPFAGYSLPVLYKKDVVGGVLPEHLHTRSHCTIFDVSHMGQIKWTGKDRASFLEKCVVSDVAGLKTGEGLLSLITNAKGGIIDDTVIANSGDYIYMVVNGACKHKDMAHFKNMLAANKHMDVKMTYMEESLALLAVQGPLSAKVIAPFLPDGGANLRKMGFMTGADMTFAGVPGCRVTRCGYTGEDGFEISIPASRSVEVAEKLTKQDGVQLAGLGARDSLRLESGLCLYGNDLDETITPVEAGLSWTMGGPKGRRRLEGGGFLGCEHVLTKDGKLVKGTRKRVGFAGMKAPARAHTIVYDASGTKKIGEITSGTFGPSLKKAVAMGYVEEGYEGTAVKLDIRGKMADAEITKMPFGKTNYFRAEA